MHGKSDILIMKDISMIIAHETIHITNVDCTCFYEIELTSRYIICLHAHTRYCEQICSHNDIFLFFCFPFPFTNIYSYVATIKRQFSEKINQFSIIFTDKFFSPYK